jgi:tetratricopeptide (TPR) repeat protein
MDEPHRKEIKKSGKGQLAKLHEEVMQDPSLPDIARGGLEALWRSHSWKGHEYRRQGRLKEAIEEFRKDTEAVITGPSQAEVPQVAFCLMGDTFMELAEAENAIAAYRQALELWDMYGYGCAPHESLARAYLKQGRVDDAIDVCEEFFRTSPGLAGWGVRQVLEEARQRRLSGEQ